MAFLFYVSLVITVGLSERGGVNSCVWRVISNWKSFHSHHSLVRAIVIRDIKRELLRFPAIPLNCISIGSQNPHSCHMVDRVVTLAHSTGRVLETSKSDQLAGGALHTRV